MYVCIYIYIYKLYAYIYIYLYRCNYFFYKLTERIIPCTLHLSYCATYRRSWKFL